VSNCEAFCVCLHSRNNVLDPYFIVQPHEVIKEMSSLYGSLKKLRASLGESLAIAPVEPPVISLEARSKGVDNDPLGALNAHLGIPVSAMSLVAVAQHVHEGSSGVFRLRLADERDSDDIALTALSSVIQARATFLGPAAHCSDALPYVCKKARDGTGIDITVLTPSAPAGSAVTILSVTVAQEDDEVISSDTSRPGIGAACVSFGYVHTPAPEGPVTAAVRAGDIFALCRALQSGGSTNEKGRVSPP
jgi:hypothetical protein